MKKCHLPSEDMKFELEGLDGEDFRYEYFLLEILLILLSLFLLLPSVMLWVFFFFYVWCESEGVNWDMCDEWSVSEMCDWERMRVFHFFMGKMKGECKLKSEELFIGEGES